MSDQAQLVSQCPQCNHRFGALQIWEPGGINDKGGWIVRCGNCQALSDFYVGKDINSSRFVEGASVVYTYDIDVENREAVLARYGVGPG